MTSLFAPRAPDLALLAADWTDVIVPVVVFVIWIINQIAGAKNKAGPQPNRPKPPPQPAQPAAGQRGLMDEVEQFLKEARKAMEQQKQAPRNPPPPPPRPQPAQQRSQPKPQKQKQKQKAAQQQRGERVPLAEQQRLQSKLEQRERDDVERGGSVSEHVSRHLDTSRFDERAGRLSHLQQTVDQDIGAHVKSAFDHKVGSLAEQSAAAPGDAVPNVAAQIAAMLADPASVRNAIVLQEILTPPTHRW